MQIILFIYNPKNVALAALERGFLGQ